MMTNYSTKMFQQPNLIGAGAGEPKHTFKLNSAMNYLYPDAERIPKSWEEYSVNDLMKVWDENRSQMEFIETKLKEHTESLESVNRYILINYRNWDDQTEEEYYSLKDSIQETIQSYEEDLVRHTYMLSLIESNFDIEALKRRLKTSK